MITENWDHIRYFVAVARAGSLTGATASLKVSPATVSRHIEDFETSLGVALFTRDQTGYQLTEIGKHLFERAKDISQNARNFYDVAYSDDGLARGAVHVAATENFANQILIPELPKFLARNPDLSVELSTGMGAVNVSRQEAEIAIRNIRPKAGNVVVKRLGYQAFCRYVSSSVTSDPGVIGWASARTGHAIPAAIEKDTAMATARLSTSSLYGQVIAARHGIGAAILPCFIGDREPSLVRDGEILEDLRQDIWLVRHADLGATPRVRVTLDFITELVASKRDLIEGRAPFPGS